MANTIRATSTAFPQHALTTVPQRMSDTNTSTGKPAKTNSDQTLLQPSISHIANPHRKSRKILSIIGRHKSLKKSDYHSMSMSTLTQKLEDTLATSNSNALRDAFKELMENFCRELNKNEKPGDHKIPSRVAGLHSAQKAVVELLSKKLKHLDAKDRYSVLRTFIKHHLQHMGTIAHAAHDPQRKAIKMLSDMIPAMIENSDDRAKLSMYLLRSYSQSQISTDMKAGWCSVDAVPTSELAMTLIKRELREAKNSADKIKPSTLTRLQNTIDAAVSGNERNVPEFTDIHTKAWKKTFNDPELLNTSTWAASAPGNKKATLRNSSAPANRFPYLDKASLEFEKNLLMMENSDLKDLLQAYQRQRGPARPQSAASKRNTAPGMTRSSSTRHQSVEEWARSVSST